MTDRTTLVLVLGVAVLGTVVVATLHVTSRVRAVDPGVPARLGELSAIEPLLGEYCEPMVRMPDSGSLKCSALLSDETSRLILLSTGASERGVATDVVAAQVIFGWDAETEVADQVCDQRTTIMSRFAQALWPSTPVRAPLDRALAGLADPERRELVVGSVPLVLSGGRVRDGGARRSCSISLRVGEAPEPRWARTFRRARALLQLRAAERAPEDGR